MGIFQPINFGWNGKTYTIPADQVLGAIAIVEEHITFMELIAATKGRPPLVAISRAFAGVLRYAGGDIADDEVYAGMFKHGSAQKQAINAVNTLLVMMVPPEELRGKTVETSSGNSRAAVRKSSARSTKRRSQNS